MKSRVPTEFTGLRLGNPEVQVLDDIFASVLETCQDPIRRATIILMRKKLELNNNLPKLLLYLMSRPEEMAVLIDDINRHPKSKPGNIPRQRLADLCGYARETVSRTINEVPRKAKAGAEEAGA